MNKYFKNIADKLFSDESSPDAARFDPLAEENLPVIWLLGKTGAGKTSLIRCLTGLSTVDIGNGFEPCTRTSQEFGFPTEDPLVRFLDTRGLDETAYDPTEDLKECTNRSHIVLVVARVDDPVQQSIASILQDISKRSKETPIVIVHNGADTITDAKQRNRARHANQQIFEQAVGRALPNTETALPLQSIGPNAHGIEALLDILIRTIPEAAILMLEDDIRNQEEQTYKSVRAQVIRYASAAGSADLAPGVGAVAVPAIQAGLLRSLGNHYKVTWTRRRLSEYSLALGVGVLLRFGGSYLSRQVAKFIPVYGQTVGALASGTISFAATFAMGRSAAYYLHQIQHGKPINQHDIRTIYKEALKQAIKTKYFNQQKK